MQELVIEAERTKRHYWREMGRYGELFCFLGGFRWFLPRHESSLDWFATLKSTGEVIGLTANGVRCFRGLERGFANLL